MQHDMATPTQLSGNVIKRHSVQLCKKCNGLGYVPREELLDYRSRETKTIHEPCSICHGDGRMIEIRTQVLVHVPSDNVELIPYTHNEQLALEPFHTETKWFRMRPDFRDWKLEQLYPELAEVSYHKYDELLKVCKSLNKIKTENQNEN